jgi:hypothetical protein
MSRERVQKTRRMQEKYERRINGKYFKLWFEQAGQVVVDYESPFVEL